MSMPEFSNPFVYAQFNMRGGWKNTLVVGAVYAVVVSGVIVATAQTSGSGASQTLHSWAVGLLVIQALTLVMYGSARVSTVVRADLKSGLMESHRLMPTSPFAVIGGYLIGAPIQALFIAVMTFVIGVCVCPKAQIDVTRWAVANMMLLAFGVMIWTLTMQLAMTSRGGVPLLFISLLIGLFSNGLAAVLLPAVSVLLCPIVGRTVFTLRDSFADFSFPYICALLAQGAVSLVCFVASVRRFRRPDEPGFNVPLGLLLLAVATGLSALGIAFDDQFTLSYIHMERSTELIASAVMCMAVALVPISAAARRRARWRRDPASTPQQKPRVPTAIAIVLAAGVIAPLFLLGRVNGMDHFQLRLELSVIETLAALAALGAVLRWAYLAVDKAWFVASIWLALFWVLPLVADTVQRSVQDRSSDPMGEIASLSPIGALIILWTGKPVVAELGVLFAVGVPLLPILLVFSTQRRQQRRRQRLSPPPLPA